MAPKTAWTVVTFLACLSADLRAQPATITDTVLPVARTFNRSPLPLVVDAVAASADDFLWIASNEGLFRFDGTHFHQIDDKSIRSVGVTADGWVWTGGTSGLRAFRSGESRQLLAQNVASIAVRGNEVIVGAERLWRGTIDGLTSLNLSANGPVSLDAQRRVWFGCEEKVCALNVDGKVDSYGREKGVPKARWMSAIANDAGRLWIWRPMITMSVSKGIPTWWNPLARQDPASIDTNGQHFRASSGRIWGDGGWVDDQPYGARAPAGGVGHESFSEDRFRTVWMGSTGWGVAALSPVPWSRVWDRSVFPAGVEAIARMPSGRLFAMAIANGVSEFDPKTRTWKQLPGESAQGHAWSAAQGKTGDIWVVLQDAGVLHLDSQNRRTGSVFEGSIDGIDYRSLYRDLTGRLWLGAKAGLYRFDEVTPALIDVPLPGGFSYAASFTRSRDGQEWLGFEGGIARLQDGVWKIEIPADALFNRRIRSIAVSAGPVFWISYRDRLPFSRVYREGGTWKRQDFTVADGYRSTETTALLVDRRGWVWRGTSEGLFVSDGTHIQPQDWLRFDRFNGLASNDVSPFGLTEDTDGAVWVSTDEGVARFEPTLNWFPPPSDRAAPRVTAIRWHNKEDLWPRPNVVLEAGDGMLEVDFAQWPETLPREPGYRHRLRPLEKEWKWTSSATVRYPSISSGDYRFELLAHDGPTTQVLGFRIASSIPLGSWWWLWALTGTVGLGAAGVFGWNRLRDSRVRADYWRERQAFLAAQDSVAATELEPGEIIEKKYVIEARIGTGGFGSVYRAHDRLSQRPVAVKVLNRSAGIEDERRRRFDREVNALRRIEHPGIVSLLDSGWLSPDQPFLVMRFVEGPTLRTLLGSERLEDDRIRRWIIALGEALGAAHTHGVLHRDLKPENIMLENVDQADEQIVIVDFGAAVIRDDLGAGASSIALVSMDYSAPERLQGKSSEVSDIYSFAVIVFELLTAIRFARLVDGRESEVRQALGGRSETLIRLLLSGTAHSADRPKDAKQFAHAIMNAINESR